MSIWVTFAASVVGGVVAAGAALGGIALAQRGENRRAAKADAQRLRDAKAERLRRLYEPLVEFALVLRQIAAEKSYVMEGDSVEDRDGRHRRQLVEGMSRTSKVAAAVIIEPGTTKVRTAYELTYQACDRYLRSLNTNAQTPGTVSLDQLRKEHDALTEAAGGLEAEIQRQLEDLEKPA